MRWIAAATAAGASLLVTWLSMRGTGGEMVYPLDDTCIHLAMAANLARHGVWGIEPGAYAFCSSSPLWTLVLAAAVKVAGARMWLPLALSTACAGGIGAVAWGIAGRRWRAAAVALVLAAAPVTALGGMGMEHAMHVLLVLLLVSAWLRGAGTATLCVLAFLCVAARYESVFLAAPLGAALLAERRWRAGLAFWAAGAMPVLAYAAYALAHGGHFFPNSLLLKTDFRSAGALAGMLADAVRGAAGPLAVLYVAGAAMAALAWRDGLRGRLGLLAASVAVAAAAHVVLVGKFQFYRYEAYLVAAAMATAAAAWDAPPCRGAGKAFAAAAAALAALGVARGIGAARDGIRAPRDIYLQQVQMARLFASIPEAERGPVAVNDLGYMCLWCGAPVVDVWGLGTQRAADLHIAAGGVFLPRNVEEVLRTSGARYAALFPKWFPPRMLPDWLKHVAILRNEGNVFCGQDSVWLYARDDASARSLRRAAQAYAARLPQGAEICLVPGVGE